MTGCFTFPFGKSREEYGEILGLPRRKDLKLVLLDVNESVPASSIPTSNKRAGGAEGVDDYISRATCERVGKLRGSTSGMAGWWLSYEIRTYKKHICC